MDSFKEEVIDGRVLVIRSDRFPFSDLRVCPNKTLLLSGPLGRLPSPALPPLPCLPPRLHLTPSAISTYYSPWATRLPVEADEIESQPCSRLERHVILLCGISIMQEALTCASYIKNHIFTLNG